MAVVDEASIRITPDTSGFAAELRAELEAEIAAATAGLDDTITIKVDVDSDAARGKLAEALNEFQNDGARAFQGLKSEQQDLFDSIAQNTEKTRDKTVIEVTKTRDRVNQRLEPFWRKLKLKQTVVKTDFDKIKKSAEDAGKAAVKAFGEGGSGEALVRSELALAKARADAEKAAAALAKAEAELSRARAALEVATTREQASQDRLTAAMSAGQRAVDDLQKAERELNEARLSGDTERIVRAEENLDKAREKVATRSAAAADAEARVVAARSATAAANDRISVSEDKLATSREKLVVASTRVEESERRVVAAHNASSQAAERHGNVLSRLGDRMGDSGRRGGVLGGIMRTLGGAFSAAGGFASSLGSTLTSTLNTAVESASGGARNAAQSFLELGAKFTVVLGIAGLVSYAVGAVGAALAGIPALAMGAAAAFAAVALGMDGIKKAYEVGLKPALDKLKVQISDVFEKTLTPAFQKLGDVLIPAVTTEMQGLAQEIANTGVAIIDMVTQGENVKKIEAIINNTASSVRDQLKPALVGIVQEFINIGAQKPIMDAMFGIISDLINNTQQWLAEMQKLGLITPAVEALRSALDTIERALFQVLTAATNFFTQATPGFNNMVTAVGNLASSLLNDLGGAFNTAMQAAADFINSIPPAALDGFKDAVNQLAQAMLEFANSGAAELIVQGITAIIDGFQEFVTLVSGVVSAFTEVKLAIAEVDNALGLATTAEVELLRAHGRVAGESNAVADALAGIPPPAEAIPPPVDAAATSLGGFGDAAGALPGAVQPPMLNTATAIEEAMRRSQAAAQTGGQGVHDGVVSPLPGMQQTTQVTFDSLPPVVQNAMVGAEAAARTGSDLVKTAVETGFNNATTAATTAMNNMRTAVETGFTAVTTAVQTGMTTMTTAVTTGFAAITTAVANAMTQVETAVTTGMTAAQTAVETATTAMQTAVETATTAMSTAFESSFTAMQTSATNAMTQIETAVTTAMTNIQTTIQTTFTTVVQIVTTSMQQVVQTVTTSLQQIQQNWQQTWQQIVQITEQSWQQINAAITAGGAQAVAKCREIAQQILQVFQELAPQLEAAGRTMMERLAAGITAGGAAAVAAARNVAAQIKAQFPASPAKEGPLSGRGDPLRTGGVIIQRLADGMRNAQSYLMQQLVPIMNATAGVLRAPAAAALTGISISRSVASASSDEVMPKHLLTTPSSAPNLRTGGGWNASNGGIRAEDGSYVNPNFYSGRPSGGSSASEVREALEGLVIRIDDRGNGLAKIVNAQNRSLSRR